MPHAAHRHRRVGRRRQEHADRPPAARHQDGVRGPARRGRPRPAARYGDGERQPRPADRRAARRARAGHHHRRRPPLLRHPAPQLHRRRHARPRAVHAQHGHRRVDRRRRHRARRRPPRRASSRPAGTRSSPRCSACTPSPSRSTRWTSSIGTRATFDRIAKELAEYVDALPTPVPVVAFPISALLGDNVVDASDRHAVVRRPGAARLAGDRSTWTPTASAPPASTCSG